MMKMVNKRMMMMMMMAEVEGIKHAQPLALFHCMHLHTQAFAHISPMLLYAPHTPPVSGSASCTVSICIHRAPPS